MDSFGWRSRADPEHPSRHQEEEQQQPSGVGCLNCKIVLGIVSVLFGPVTFTLFVFVFHNYNAGVWGLFAGLVAAFSLHINLSYKFGRLTRFYSTRGLRILRIASIVALLASTVATMTYFIYGKVNKIPFSPVQGSPMIAGVQAFMAVKSCLFYLLTTRSYLKILGSQEQLCVSVIEDDAVESAGTEDTEP